jgi:hypothetical protein
MRRAAGAPRTAGLRCPSDWSHTHARRCGGEALRRLNESCWPSASDVTAPWGTGRRRGARSTTRRPGPRSRLRAADRAGSTIGHRAHLCARSPALWSVASWLACAERGRRGPAIGTSRARRVCPPEPATRVARCSPQETRLARAAGRTPVSSEGGRLFRRSPCPSIEL